MGLLDQLAGQVLGKFGAQQGDAAPQGDVMNSVLGLIDRAGGVDGLLQKLKDSGLDKQVASWIGVGQNESVSADQITEAVGSDTVDDVARDAGVEPGKAAAGLAALLPQVIDQLTPEGSVPRDELLQQGLNLLKSKFLG